MSNLREPSVKRVGENIVIELPIDTLVHACMSHPDEPYYIIDKDSYADFVVKHLFHFDEDGAGTAQFFRVFDELNVEAFISAEPFIVDEIYADDFEPADGDE